LSGRQGLWLVIDNGDEQGRLFSILRLIICSTGGARKNSLKRSNHGWTTGSDACRLQGIRGHK
ncbi:hypothetical protein E2562_018839, partial [Oryza meyeriana var. granulata]